METQKDQLLDYHGSLKILRSSLFFEKEIRKRVARVWEIPRLEICACESDSAATINPRNRHYWVRFDEVCLTFVAAASLAVSFSAQALIAGICHGHTTIEAAMESRQKEDQCFQSLLEWEEDH